ncbi:hypothetical protein GPECTOR_10g995 [Gonium pectorale]|uniref:Uncharacterized protein n=1 Tax=Gonium pectorale TaxID=33097 RepID=A0A150GRC1_GONPE|nr:hypothetical protein GPECTOR_10g995 [Gonium pectorale]|eukprot:KXZ52361.1 hypothetical protein GPECTOR_10g995 [Gonium pectorale]
MALQESLAVASGPKKQARITRFLTAFAQRERLLSLFGGCRSLTHVTLTDKLLTPGAARELLAAAPGLSHLALERSWTWRASGAAECEGVPRDAVVADSKRLGAEALASGLPLVLHERTASLTSLRINWRCPELPEAATDALAGCIRLQHLEIGPPQSSTGQAAIVGLTDLCSLTLHNALGGREKVAADLGFLSALSAASCLTQLSVRPVSYWMWSPEDLERAPLDVAALSGLCSLVELSLEGAVLDGEGMRCLASLTALTLLEAHTLRATDLISLPELAEVRQPAPLSWPMPPALRHLSLVLAEVAALAALRPPQSLEVVEIDLPDDQKVCEDISSCGFTGFFFHTLPGNHEQHRLPAGSGLAMRGAVTLLTDRLQSGAPLCVCTSASQLVGFVEGEADPVGHTGWLAELRPMGLTSLRLDSLALDAADLVQLVASVPDLEDLTFYNCDLTIGALPVLHRLTHLRRLEFYGPYLWSDPEVQPDLVRGPLLGLCAADSWRPELELVFNVHDTAEQETLEGTMAWVKRQMQLLGSRRRMKALFRA